MRVIDSIRQLDTIERKDLKDHPVVKSQKPSPVGIVGSVFYQYKGTNIGQWWAGHRDAYWRPAGKLIVLEDHALRSGE